MYSSAHGRNRDWPPYHLTVMIPAAQWPFHRWLLDSAIAPTPVSAVMHAGLVNVGGVMLTRFAPMFSGDGLQLILLVPAVFPSCSERA
ncbi:proton-conducting transporter membrane subunit [Bacillus licheniformis]|nr:proton-conducting transporter membrane subunit [Bacillus licheniformis]